VAAALPGLVFAIIALAMLREPRRGQADLDDALGDNPLLAAFLREPEDRYTMRQSLGHIWRIRSLRYLIFANATFGFALFGLVFFLPTYFERSFGFTVEQAGAVQAVIALGTFIGTWLGGPLADRNLDKGFGYLCRVGCLAALVLAVCWPLAFAIGIASITIPLLALSSLVSSLAVPGVVAVVAATAPPRIRSQAFSYFGLALSVCGAATAPLLIGALSELFQSNGVDQADALRFSMLLCVAVVMTVGTVLVVAASRHAERDVNDTITAFLAEMTPEAQQPATESGGLAT
jgi:MFS family permease